jgi:Flp pilus assembly pilin Flp
MTTNKNTFAKLWRDVRGISSVEYALLLAFVGGGIIAGGLLLSGAVEGEMNRTACVISNASSTPC